MALPFTRHSLDATCSLCDQPLYDHDRQTAFSCLRRLAARGTVAATTILRAALRASH